MSSYCTPLYTTVSNRHHEHNNDHVLSFGEKISSLHKSFSHINAQITVCALSIWLVIAVLIVCL